MRSLCCAALPLMLNTMTRAPAIDDDTLYIIYAIFMHADDIADYEIYATFMRRCALDITLIRHFY